MGRPRGPGSAAARQRGSASLAGQTRWLGACARSHTCLPPSLRSNTPPTRASPQPAEKIYSGVSLSVALYNPGGSQTADREGTMYNSCG